MLLKSVLLIVMLFAPLNYAYLICANKPVQIQTAAEHLSKIQWIASTGDRFDTLDAMGGAKGDFYHIRALSGDFQGKEGYALVSGFGSCVIPNDTRVGAYDPTAALAYVDKWYSSANHDCKSAYDVCSPWSYWGEESCGYPSHGGDCADFVSQSLVTAGHPYLNTGGTPCRGYPCGKEEIGAKNLGDCLSQKFNWNTTCGHKAAPPSYIKVGDVLIFHGTSCTDTEAHATIVTKVDGKNVYISCHSPDTHTQPYTIFSSNFGYFQWLHYKG